VERTERQWEAYSGFKDWQADQERRKLLSWEDLAAELVQELSSLRRSWSSCSNVVNRTNARPARSGVAVPVRNQ